MTTRLMTAAALATCLFAAGSALAADTAPQNLKTVQALFDFADQNHDGRLTREEARGHLPLTYGSFDRVDSARRGWISFEQFVAFTNQRAGGQAEEVLKLGQWH
jgi:hypothetical protein